MTRVIASGWYLMTDSEVERLLLSVKNEEEAGVGVPLEGDRALAFRNAGNLPDSNGRSLRLVLNFAGPGGDSSLDELRLRFEPDFHEPPSWRREGSRSVNVIPLGLRERQGMGAWWEEPEVAELEKEWSRTGGVGGMKVPAGYRSFVYKTVIALRRSDLEVTPETIADSVSRWMLPSEAEDLRRALLEANDQAPGN